MVFGIYHFGPLVKRGLYELEPMAKTQQRRKWNKSGFDVHAVDLSIMRQGEEVLY